MRVGHELLQWSDAFATGDARIDQQHKMLINILNDANQGIRGGQDAEVQVKIMANLIGYTTDHFDSEEGLMAGGATAISS